MDNRRGWSYKLPPIACLFFVLSVQPCYGQISCPAPCQLIEFECVCPRRPDPASQNPSLSTQPQHACLINVADLPEYDGFPTPEMQAASIGLSTSIAGMLEPWFIEQDHACDYDEYDSVSGAADAAAKGASNSSKQQRGSSSSTGRSKQPPHPPEPRAAAPKKPPNTNRGTPAGRTAADRQSGRGSATGRQPGSSSSINTGRRAGRTSSRGSRMPPGSSSRGGSGSSRGRPAMQVGSNRAPATPPRPAPSETRRRAAQSKPDDSNISNSGRGSIGSSRSGSQTVPNGRQMWGAPAPQPQQQTVPRPGPAAPPAGNYIVPRPAAASQAAVASTTAGLAAASDWEPTIFAADASLTAGVAAAAAGVTDVLDELPLLTPAAAATAVNATAMPAATSESATQPGPLANATAGQRLITATTFTNTGRACNKGTYTRSEPSNFVKRSITAAYGTLGITIQGTNVIPPDPTLAVGPNHALHVVNSLVKVIPLTPSGNINLNPRPGEQRTIPLPDFFSTVASPCEGGYIYPWAAYDKEVGRFLLTCICAGVDSSQILLAISTTSSAVGTWILYSFNGEVTQGSSMACQGYPVSAQSQVTYNRDGVYLSWVQNCPENQEQQTGAILLALPKWAVYKGATWFYAPIWTAWDIFDAVNIDSEAYYPGAFLQLQPVMPQRPEDVQAEVVYFVMDNLNYVSPLQRTELTVVALFNTGSLWLYEGPNSDSPNPLLVARVINRGVRCLAVPDTKLVQPVLLDNTLGPQQPLQPSQQCAPLDAGSMRPPGFWDGGAALYANQIYLANRGPDITSNFTFVDTQFVPMPTIYWAVLTPSFCVSGPCAPYFGTDWGWSDGWDWTTGTWDDKSERAKYPWSDPSYYNQVFLYPSGTSSTGAMPGRSPYRRLHQATTEIASGAPSGNTTRSSSSSSGTRSESTARDAVGVPLPPKIAAMIDRSHIASEITTRMGPALSQDALAAAIKATLDRLEANPPSTEANVQNTNVQLIRNISVQAAVPATGPLVDITVNSAYPAPEVLSADLASGSNTSNITVSLSAPNSNASSGSTTSVANLFLGVNHAWGGFTGWGYDSGAYYADYYQWWREHYFLRNLYMNLRIPPKTNPCKYYKDWYLENTITFGALVSRRGVLDFVTLEENPVGVAFPQVAVVGGAMLVVYSFSGPFGVPNVGNPNILAYPGIGYSFIPPDQQNGPYEIEYAKLPGNETLPQCIRQWCLPHWGSYSGIDVHYPSMKILSAVETSWSDNRTNDLNTNAATWINVFV